MEERREVGREKGVGGKSRGGEEERERGGEGGEERGREWRRGEGRGGRGAEGRSEISRNIKAFPAAEHSHVRAASSLIPSLGEAAGPGAAGGILKRGRLPGILGVGAAVRELSLQAGFETFPSKESVRAEGASGQLLGRWPRARTTQLLGAHWWEARAGPAQLSREAGNLDFM